jgi:hypothetical protein
VRCNARCLRAAAVRVTCSTESAGAESQPGHQAGQDRTSERLGERTLDGGSLSNQRRVNTRARYVWAIGVMGAAILAGEEEAGKAAGSKDH